MLSKGPTQQADFDAIRAQVEEELVEIVKFAEESPDPEEAALCEFVYVDPIPHR